MNSEEVPLLTGAKLKEAFRQPVCPLCHLRQEALDWYFSQWVWDYVSDPHMRERMRRGLGLCPEHMWQLYRTDLREYGNALGVSAIYEGLLAEALNRLTAAAELAARRRARHLPWYKRLARHSLRKHWFRPTVWRGNNILQAEHCHVCAYNEEAERRAVYWLVLLLTEETFRGAYAASAGLCLRHLRLALDLALQIDPEVAQFLAEKARESLARLRNDLAAYNRKNAVGGNANPLTPAEGEAPYRVSLFFAGPDVWREQRRRLDSL